MNFEEAAVALNRTPMWQLKITLGNLNEFLRILIDYIFTALLKRDIIKTTYLTFVHHSVVYHK